MLLRRAVQQEEEEEQDSKDKIIRTYLEKLYSGIFGVLTRKFMGCLSVATSVTFMWLTQHEPWQIDPNCTVYKKELDIATELFMNE